MKIRSKAPSKWIRIGQVAEMLGVSTRTVTRWEESGDFLTAVRINNTKSWDQDAVQDWMAAKTNEAAA